MYIDSLSELNIKVVLGTIPDKLWKMGTCKYPSLKGSN